MSLITSLSNPKIKQVRRLQQRKYRRESGLAFVEGIRHVGEALEASSRAGLGLEVDSLYYAPDLLDSEYADGLVRQAQADGVACYPLSPEVFTSISSKENPPGLLALIRPRYEALDNLNPQNFPWGVALVSPQDPGNIGTISRTLDSAGASGLLILEGGADPYHPSAVRASMGALFWHPVVEASFADFALWARQEGYTIYGSSARGSLDYRQVGRYRQPAILLLGSERQGLTSEQISQCDVLLRLPMQGRVSSLNLAVAAGVLLYAMSEITTSAGVSRPE
jgi:TrmH family RNA methyltransferase